jgi:hypothetical protein
VNCCIAPLGTVGFVGVTAIETREGAVAVKVVKPEIAPDVAIIDAVPDTATAVAKPPGLLTVATLALEELQTTDPVILAVVLSE